MTPDYMKYLLEHDTVHGRFSGTCSSILYFALTGAFIVLSIKFESTSAFKASTLFVTGNTIGAAWFALLSEVSIIRASWTFSASAFVYLTTTATLLIVIQEESYVTSVASSLAF